MTDRLHYKKGKSMNDDYIEGIEVEPVSEHYIVTFLQDKPDGEGTFARVIHLDAPDHVTAIQYAQRIDMAAKAEVMTDWLPPEGMEKKILGDNPTIEDIKKLHAKFLEDGMFKAFMMQDYKAIQVSKAEDVEELNEETFNTVMKYSANIGDEAEEFLRKEGNDTT
jgi:hypothetical protein